MLSALRGLAPTLPRAFLGRFSWAIRFANAPRKLALGNITESAVDFDFVLMRLISVTFLMPVMALTLFEWFSPPRMAIRPDSLD